MNTAAFQISSSFQDSTMQNVAAAGADLQATDGATQERHEKITKAAQNFESYLYGYMFKTMYNSVQKSEFTQNSLGNDIFMQMFIDEAAKQNIEKGTNSIAAMLIKQYECNLSAKDKKITDSLREVQNAKSSATPEVTPQDTSVTPQNLQDAFAHFVGKMAGKITSEYGMRKHPIHGDVRMHDGVDYALQEGTPLTPPAPGTVTFAGKAGGYGNTVVVDHGEGWATKYAHLSEITVKEGDKITPSNVLGKVGSTGVSTGPHLHLEVLHDGKPLNPLDLATGKNL